MATFYYKLITNSLFCNKKRLIIAYILFFIAFLILLFIGRKEIENKIVLLIFMSTCIFGAYKTYKINDFNYLTYNLDSKSYDYYPLEINKISYHETFNKLISDKINSKELDIESTKKIDNFLLNFNNEFISKLKENITFERFDEYFTSINKDKTTSKLFYFQYKKSLIKIIKDFIIKTDKLENATDETISKFIRALTNQDNLKFNQKKGLHYKDKFVSKFLKKNNNQKTIIQENVTSDVNEQIKIENIPIFKFYRILTISIEEICKIQLNKNEKEELKSIIGFYFKSKKNNDILKFKKDLQNISFTNSKISKKFILILKHLTEIHHLENHESKLSRILTLGINEKSFPRKVKNRTESIRKCYRNNNLSKNEKIKINHILQEFLNNKI